MPRSTDIRRELAADRDNQAARGEDRTGERKQEREQQAFLTATYSDDQMSEGPFLTEEEAERQWAAEQRAFARQYHAQVSGRPIVRA